MLCKRREKSYQERTKEIANLGFSIGERFEGGRNLLREMRRSVTAACLEPRPQHFGRPALEREDLCKRAWQEGPLRA
jgi:hypothetical protein